MLRMGRGIVVIWQPVRLEREITTGARARVVEHLSSSHRNDSHDPAGSHYFTTPLSHGDLTVARMMIAMGFYERRSRLYSNCLRRLVGTSPISFQNSQSRTQSADLVNSKNEIEHLSPTEGHMVSVRLRKGPTNLGWEGRVTSAEYIKITNKYSNHLLAKCFGARVEPKGGDTVLHLLVCLYKRV